MVFQVIEEFSFANNEFSQLNFEKIYMKIKYPNSHHTNEQPSNTIFVIYFDEIIFY